MIEPFKEISIELLNDATDSSSIELDDILLCSCNSFDWEPPDGISNELQNQIHDTVKRIKQILEDYRNGQLSYR